MKLRDPDLSVENMGQEPEEKNAFWGCNLFLKLITITGTRIIITLTHHSSNIFFPLKIYNF